MAPQAKYEWTGVPSHRLPMQQRKRKGCARIPDHHRKRRTTRDCVFIQKTKAVQTVSVQRHPALDGACLSSEGSAKNPCCASQYAHVLNSICDAARAGMSVVQRFDGSRSAEPHHSLPKLLYVECVAYIDEPKSTLGFAAHVV
jgi:hypothetical protein